MITLSDCTLPGLLLLSTRMISGSRVFTFLEQQLPQTVRTLAGGGLTRKSHASESEAEFTVTDSDLPPA